MRALIMELRALVWQTTTVGSLPVEQAPHRDPCPDGTHYNPMLRSCETPQQQLSFLKAQRQLAQMKRDRAAQKAKL
jgi:hypothetical protein